MLEIRNISSSEWLWSRRASAGCKRAPHQPQPEDESAEEKDLPDAAEVYVFVPLRAKPEPEIPSLC